MNLEFSHPVELNDAELDAVTGGAATGPVRAVAAGAGGLVVAGVNVVANVPVDVQNNNIAIGILAEQSQSQ